MTKIDDARIAAHGEPVIRIGSLVLKVGVVLFALLSVIGFWAYGSGGG